jgi:hypothetical protein
MIHIWWGAPREGKTYSCTRLAVERMLKGRRVYSNYPIITRGKKVFSSLVWEDKFIYEPIHNADIFIDEAYRSYSSRDFKNFTKDMHTFFATNGHNDLEIHLIAQNPARVDLIIREICNYFHFVRKVSIPWIFRNPEGKFSRPLWFVDWVFLSEDDMVSRSKERVQYIERHLFSKKFAEAYDTHYYRNRDLKPLPLVTWLEKIEKENDQEVKKVSP